MTERKAPRDATLLDVLIDGFEKNEILAGFHWRDLPMPSAEIAAEKFEALVGEVCRWKGEPATRETRADRRRAAWPDLDIRQAGRGIRVCVKSPEFDEWWHEAGTWAGDPMGALRDWMREEEP